MTSTSPGLPGHEQVTILRAMARHWWAFALRGVAAIQLSKPSSMPIRCIPCRHGVCHERLAVRKQARGRQYPT